MAHLFGLLAAVFAMLHFSSFTDVKFFADSIQLRHSPLAETVFHQGIVNALKTGYPPPALYASGYLDLSGYHLAMHAGIELIHRVAGLDTVKLTYIYFPLAYLFLISATVYTFFQKTYQAGSVALIIGLMMFGSNLSFIPGVFEWGYSNYPWVFFLPDTIWSLFTLNGYTPSILVLLLSLMFLWDYFDQKRTASLGLSLLCGVVATCYKTSMGLHILGTFVLLGLVLLISAEGKAQAKQIGVAFLLAIAAVFVEIKVLRGGGTFGHNLEFAPFNQFKLSLTKMQIFDLTAFTMPVAFAAYIVGVFSSKLAGFSLVTKGAVKQNASVLFLVLFCISGFLGGEFFYLGQKGAKINNAAFFTSQSLMAGWLLLGMFLVDLKQKVSNRWFVIVITTVVLLAVLGTIEFLNKRYGDEYFTYDRDALDIVSFLEQLPAETVTLYPPDIPGPSLSSTFAGRPSVLSNYMSFLPEDAQVSQRFQAGVGFFRPETPESFRRFLIDFYQVDVVYAPTKYQAILDKSPSLTKVYLNKSYVVYKVNTLGN
jgi:hypothetical protein